MFVKQSFFLFGSRRVFNVVASSNTEYFSYKTYKTLKFGKGDGRAICDK
jgi:hypothetical protein